MLYFLGTSLKQTGMSVTYEDAIATLVAMFPEWDKGTLGIYISLLFSILILLAVSKHSTHFDNQSCHSTLLSTESYSKSDTFILKSLTRIILN